MKLKKILAAVAAAAVAVSTMAVSAFAANILDSDAVLGTDWKGIEISADKFADVAEGDKVTLTYTITPADYNLVRLCANATGWADFEGHASAVCNVDDPSFKHQDGNDFMVVSIDGSITYTLTAKDAEDLKTVGGVITGYSVVVTSVEVESAAAAAPAEEEAAPAADAKSNVVELNKDAGYIDGHTPSVTITSADFGATDIKSVAIDIAIAPKADGFEWNDWCGSAVKVTDADGVKYYAFGGAQVTWNNDVDDDGTDDVIGGVNGDQWLGTVSNGAITLNVPVNGDFTIDIITMWYDSYAGTTYTVKTATADGAAVAAAPVAEEAPEAEEAEDEDVDVDVEEEEEETEAEPVAEEPAPAVEEAPAPAVENATAAPATGNTAVATVVAVMAVAGAAAIVSKKRK